MNTNELIEQLAKGLTPVEPLWRSGRRTAVWAVAACAYVALLAALIARGAVPNAGAGGAFWWPQVLALMAALMAARAAFASVVPGARGGTVWAALAALAWLASLGATAAWQGGAVILGKQHEWACVAFIALGGLPPLAALALMLRRGAPLRPVATGALAALAVGALASVGACWSLPHPENDVTLVWHGTAVLALVVLAGAAAKFGFRWPRSPA